MNNTMELQVSMKSLKKGDVIVYNGDRRTVVTDAQPQRYRDGWVQLWARRSGFGRGDITMSAPANDTVTMLVEV